MLHGVAVRARVDLRELHRYSLDEYHRLIDAGGFDEDERVELLDGLLVSMSPKTPAHERAVRWLAQWLWSAVDTERYEIGVASPLTLGDSEPEPDVAVLERDAPGQYHPATAALVVEVAVSSLARDLVAKADLYASADIQEYWVLDLRGRRVVVHREPAVDGYARRFELTERDQLSARALALPALDLGNVFQAAEH
jgi:Uma2 family endonuclease